MANELKPKIYCPSCHRLLNVAEGKGEGDEMECPFCMAQFALEITPVYEGRITKQSPIAVVDEKTPEAWRTRGTCG